MEILLVILGIIAVLAVILIGIYNRLVALRQTCNQAWSDIEVQLKQRQDLVPQLVNTVKGYAKHEKTTFEEVVKARQMAVSANTPGAQAAAEGMLSQASCSYKTNSQMLKTKSPPLVVFIITLCKNIIRDVNNSRLY